MTTQEQSERELDPVLDLVRNVRGTATRIAAVCGVSREAVWNWRRVPGDYVLRLETLLNIPRHCIRPDLYPPPSDPGTKRWLKQWRQQNGARASS